MLHSRAGSRGDGLVRSASGGSTDSYSELVCSREIVTLTMSVLELPPGHTEHALVMQVVRVVMNASLLQKQLMSSTEHPD